ncbi:MAG: LPS assembly lipoprotein LptE [Paludibacteraceae bacterium]|nr:LPS assembly lipoprotein LptE [Paludibacteraceae bacterium]
MKRTLLATLVMMICSSCLVSYKFNGASIDYTKTKSITISEFPNYAPLVYTPLTIQLNDAIANKFAQQTRLNIVRTGGDLQLDGEITGYQLAATAIGADNRASENKLTLTVKIHFVNNVTGDEIENQFSAYRTFSSSSTLNDVQDGLISELVEEVVDQIFNATVANW